MPQLSSTPKSSEQRSLLDNLRELHAGKRPAKPPRATPADADGSAFDFSTHPAYSEVKIAKAAGTALGLRSPFFRVAEAVEGTGIKIDGRWVKNFASYDYLSLNRSEAVRERACAAIGEWGVSATASRLVGGERTLHADLETRLARFIGTEAALAMVSGHATNLAVIKTLLGANDLVLVDSLAHNSIYEGIRASGAAHATFPHNDFRWVDDHLSDMRSRFNNVLIVVEGLYSMDGDVPDLAGFVQVKKRHGAWLMVDEAHSLGVLGATGRGICEAQSIAPEQVEVIMGTLSKSFCSCGGFIAGSHALIDLLRYRAPGFVYSVGLSSPNAAAASAALDQLDAEPERVRELRTLCLAFREKATALGLDVGESQGYAICPVIIADSLKAVWIANRLLDAGFNVLPIIAPAVPDKSARLRFFLNRAHDEASIDAVLAATAALREKVNSMSITEMAAG